MDQGTQITFYDLPAAGRRLGFNPIARWDYRGQTRSTIETNGTVSSQTRSFGNPNPREAITYAGNELILAVRNGGNWDYKQKGSQYEDFGNFNYGATGRAVGIPAQILKRGAGWAQTRAGTSKKDWGKPLGSPPHGDDPADQKQIQRGIDYHDSLK